MRHILIIIIFIRIELDYCENNPNTCLNDGKCTSLIKDDGFFKCECPSGFRGRTCQIVPPMMAAALAEAVAENATAIALSQSTLIESDANRTPAASDPQGVPDKTPLVPKKPSKSTKPPTTETTFSMANQVALNAMLANIEKEMNADDEHHDDDVDNEA